MRMGADVAASRARPRSVSGSKQVSVQDHRCLSRPNVISTSGSLIEFDYGSRRWRLTLAPDADANRLANRQGAFRH